MATFIGKEDKAEDLLKNLISLDYDAAEAYQAAVSRLQDAACKQNLENFRQDHIRHTQNLGKFLIQLGKTPPTGPDAKMFLTKGKVVMADLFGDKAILTAMKTNEDDTNTAYERAVNHKDITIEMRQILQENLQDERRHREWIENKIKELK